MRKFILIIALMCAVPVFLSATVQQGSAVVALPDSTAALPAGTAVALPGSVAVLPAGTAVALSDSVAALPVGAAVALPDSTASALPDSTALALPDSASTARKVPTDFGYSAKSLRLQKRYTAADASEFTSVNALSNMFGGVSFDYYLPLTADFIWGPVASFYGGKAFTKVSSVRAVLNMGLMKDVYYGRSQAQIGLIADYMANLSSLVRGYNKYSICDISAFAGIGFKSIYRSRYFTTHPAAHAGINFNFHLLKMMDLFIEPKLEIFGYREENVTDRISWRKYDLALNISFGLAFSNVQRREWPETLGINWYLLLFAAPQWQHSRAVYTLGLGRNLGGAVSVGVGYHFTKWLDFRISGFYSQDGWNNDNDGKRIDTRYCGVRCEGLFDIANMVTKRDDTRVSGGIVFGPEIGYMHKEPVRNDEIKTAYFGFTLGAQCKYRLNDRFKIFFEPRFNFVPYSALTNNPELSGAQHLYYDGLFNASVGVEYHFRRRNQ